MSINSILISAVKPITGICVPNLYIGLEKEYATFNYSEIPQVTAENGPAALLYSVQLHWFTPLDTNPSAKKKQIREALMAAGCTCPSVVNASDNDKQHLVFEFELLGEGFDG